MMRLLRYYISRWSVLLLFIEGAVAIWAVYAGVAIRFSEQAKPDEIHDDMLLPRALFFAFVMLVSMAATGRYRRLMEEGVTGEALSVSLSFIIGLVAMSLLFYVFPDLFLGRGAFGYALLFAWLSFLMIRKLFFMFVMDMDLLKRRLLIFGTGENARLAAKVVERGGTGFKLLGYWPVPGHEERVDPSAILHTEEELAEFSHARMADEIVIALDEPFPELLMDDIMACKTQGIRILDLPEFFEQEWSQINMDILDAHWWVSHSDGLNQGSVGYLVKRVFDISISILLLLISWPIMVLAALAILIESQGRGPVFYSQERVGVGGLVFRVVKFRSMRTDAEKDGVARWAERDDQRTTRVGRFIRKTRIDEFPQFFNVLKGEMSLVGPRPERPAFVELLKNKIPFYSERLRLKPGITGWAQVRYGYGASEQDAAEKLKYDLYYVKNRNLLLDLLVLIHSVEVVLFGQGAPGPRPHDMPESSWD